MDLSKQVAGRVTEGYEKGWCRMPAKLYFKVFHPDYQLPLLIVSEQTVKCTDCFAHTQYLPTGDSHETK